MKRTYETIAYTDMFTRTDKLYKKYAKPSNAGSIVIDVARTVVRTLLPEIRYFYNTSRVEDYK